MKTTHLAVLSAFAWMAGSAAAQEAAEPVATEQTQPAASEAAAPRIPPGARVHLEIVDALTSNTATVGQRVALRTFQPIRANGMVVIPAGTPGVGEVIDARPRGMGGVPGLLVVASRHLDFNGQQVRLEGMIVSASGRGRGVATASVSMGAAGVFIPGLDVEVAAGTRASVRIAGGPPRVAMPVEGVNPVPSPSPGKAYVVFYQRIQMGEEFYTFGVAEEGVPLARLRGNRYLPVAVDPGIHEFEVLAPMGGRRTGVILHQEILEGQIIFIRHDEFYLSPGDEEDFMSLRLREASAANAED